jgi:hypothetical protein
MTDFIHALEEQLITAHRDRRRRRFALPSWRTGAVLVAAAAAVVVAVVAVLALASPDDRHPAAKPPAHRATPAPVARELTVTVINATTVTGLARAAADTLAASGFRQGTVTNDPNEHNRMHTSVYYEDGYREQAQAAAGFLQTAPDEVLFAPGPVRELGNGARIVVVLGRDFAP